MTRYRKIHARRKRLSKGQIHRLIQFERRHDALEKPAKRKQRYSTRRRRTCKTVCTVCGNAYPAGKMTPQKYVRHVTQWHTSKIYC
jgi:hypothetical protein